MGDSCGQAPRFIMKVLGIYVPLGNPSTDGPGQTARVRNQESGPLAPRARQGRSFSFIPFSDAEPLLEALPFKHR